MDEIRASILVYGTRSQRPFVNTKTNTYVGLEYMAKLLAAIIVIVVAYRSRSMGLSVLFGLVAVAILATFLTV